MKVSEVMTSDVQTVTPDQSAREAASFMLRAEAGSIPVTEGDKVIGMITDRDIAVRGVAEGRGPDTPVRDLMSDDIICARQDDDVHKTLRSAGIRGGDVVVGFDGKSIDGSMRDLLGFVRRNYLVGDEIVVNVIRDGKPLEIKLVLR